MTQAQTLLEDFDTELLDGFAPPAEPAALKPRKLKARPKASLHVQLADILREMIYSKRWSEGTKLPSEHELMETFDVSRGTVRRALKSLVDEGLLEQQHGRGSFVAKPTAAHPAGIRPLSFAESFREQGKALTTRVIEHKVAPAPPDIAAELGLAPGTPALFLRRVRIVDGKPVMYQEGWSNLAECPGLDEVDFTSNSLFSAVQHYSGRRIKYATMRYQARIAGREHGELLACEESAAVLLLEQTVRLEDNTAIECSQAWFRPGQSIVGMAMQPQ